MSLVEHLFVSEMVVPRVWEAEEVLEDRLTNSQKPGPCTFQVGLQEVGLLEAVRMEEAFLLAEAHVEEMGYSFCSTKANTALDNKMETFIANFMISGL